MLPGSFKVENHNHKKIILNWLMRGNMKLQIGNAVFELGEVRKNLKIMLKREEISDRKGAGRIQLRS
jgi:hypothetical protein